MHNALQNLSKHVSGIMKIVHSAVCIPRQMLKMLQMQQFHRQFRKHPELALKTGILMPKDAYDLPEFKIWH